MRRITVAIVIDENLGISFYGRRQSRDSLLIEDLVKSTRSDIYVTSYSSNLFGGYEERVKITDNPLASCENDAVCFLEMAALSEYIQDVNKLIIYNWNRAYPHDKKLDIDPENLGFNLVDGYDFVGSSHDKITKKIYTK